MTMMKKKLLSIYFPKTDFNNRKKGFKIDTTFLFHYIFIETRKGTCGIAQSILFHSMSLLRLSAVDPRLLLFGLSRNFYNRLPDA